MRSTSGRIIKASDIKIEGKFTLDLVPIEPGSSKQTATALVEPQVRIVESKPEFSVIEITCSCGEKMSLRCEYAPAPAPKSPPQNNQAQATKKAK
jgi:hypothetical protein